MIMQLDLLLPHIFTLNIVLAIIDAAIGYHAAPLLIRVKASDEEALAQMAKGIMAMLAVVVGLYSFFSCLAFYQQKPLLLLLVTAIIIADIVAQVIITTKIKTGNE